MSSPTSTTLLDEFQAFVGRVKQLHMSRSADADSDQMLSHDKAVKKRYDRASMGGAGGGSVDSEDSLLKSPPTIVKSLDDHELRKRGNFFNPSLDDIEMESTSEVGELEENEDTEDDDEGDEVVAEEMKEKDIVKSGIRGETKEMKKNIQVMVGIDEDLKMILEMDPEIVDLGNVAKTTADPKVLGLPPLTGG